MTWPPRVHVLSARRSGPRAGEEGWGSVSFSGSRKFRADGALGSQGTAQPADTALLGEIALRQCVGGDAVMREQLRQLLKVARGGGDPGGAHRTGRPRTVI
ncbi:Scr1 family TA system antitoxin-like transcriptional regulator [Amycolatopsis sp. NPDC051071]|uniref:Scr1 family TA system antitoxin-like transcriptional regulator n=1 Tax=Amycolatopsis sp. NPDC051071 TaxID=3154637 RepID=UPI00342E6474